MCYINLHVCLLFLCNSVSLSLSWNLCGPSVNPRTAGDKGNLTSTCKRMKVNGFYCHKGSISQVFFLYYAPVEVSAFFC
jgi:hypothetical protein